MKYFEVSDPYYALIKARNEEEARLLYVECVADDDEGLEIEEVHFDYAVATYARAISVNGELIPLSEVLNDIRSDKGMVMLVDMSLI